MENLKKITFIALFTITMFIGAFLIANAIYYKGMPYSWQAGGHSVVDSNFYGGEYYQVNDTLRIIAETDGNKRFDKFVLYENKNNAWIRTSVSAYKTTNKNKSAMLDFLRSQYNDYLDDIKYKNNEGIWKY